jgi:hypothetical protein
MVEDRHTGDLTFWGQSFVEYNFYARRPFILKVDSNGCMGSEYECSNIQPVLVSSEDVIQEEGKASRLYPNPSTDQIIIEQDYIGEKELRVTNFKGILIESQRFREKKFVMDVSKYIPGL